MDDVIHRDEHLLATLADLGFSLGDMKGVGLRVLHQATPESAMMAETYQFVNDSLSDLVRRRSVMRIHHVTGEARALLDPAHRRVLRRAASSGEPGRLLCSFTVEGTPTARNFVTQQHIHWDSASWVDFVDLLSLAAASDVFVRVLEQPEPIHFSLFGDDFVLLQDRHHHPTAEKRVWFIRSAALAEHLTPRVSQLWNAASAIPALTFADVMNQLHDYETIAVATALLKGENHELYEFDYCDRLRVQDALSLLSEIGFAERSDLAPKYMLTPIGEAWVSNWITQQ